MEVRKNFQLGDNENTIYQNLQYAAKAVHGGRFVALEKYKINRLSILIKNQKNNRKKNQRKKIIEIRAN